MESTFVEVTLVRAVRNADVPRRIFDSDPTLPARRSAWVFRTEDAERDDDRKRCWGRALLSTSVFLTASCTEADLFPPLDEPEVLRTPVVVHVIHAGEDIGVGHNLSDERIEAQIRTLNEDFRRKAGTPGHNTHPDSDDARIEFVLASVDPDGNPTSGIVRVDTTGTGNPTPPGSLSTTSPGTATGIPGGT